MNLKKLESEKMRFKKIIHFFVISLIVLIPNSSWSLTNVLGDKITIINYSAIEAKLIDSQDGISNPNLSPQPKVFGLD